MIDKPSPNFDARRPGAAVDMLLLHYTGMPTAQAALQRMCDAAAQVSAHYMINEDGSVVRLVDETQRAWHAGEAFWKGERDVNSCSIGIELVNPGHEFGYRAFPEAQMAALVGLAREIVARHAIPPVRVLAHSDVAPQRKQDPGELFDWSRLAEAGVGLWPFKAAALGLGEGPVLKPGAEGEAVAAAQNLLATYGYEATVTGYLDAPTMKVVAAFQRHFRPVRTDGHFDADTANRLVTLVEHQSA